MMQPEPTDPASAGGADAWAVPPAAHPERIGAYRILGRLGQGGMATVYVAEHTALGRKVALKLMHRGMRLVGVARERFEREARAASRIDHPGICALYEAGEHDGEPFMAMRLVPGEPLAQAIARAREETRGPLLPADSDARVGAVVALIEQAARALHLAHEHGLVHRDIKPSNIMVTPEGEPVILDFGIAFDESDTDHALTLSGQVVGTPAYMAPEQIQRRAVDRRTDVHALGLVLYECLTLVRPFEGPTQHEIWRRILENEAYDPRRYNPAVGRDLCTVLATALRKDPGRRYVSALAFAEDLRCVRVHLPIAARPQGPLVRAARWVQRNPLPAALVAVLAAGVAASSYFWLSAQAQLQRFDLIALRLRLEQARAEAPRLVPAVPAMTAALQEWLVDRARPLLGARPAVAGALAGFERAPPLDERGRFLRQSLATMATDLDAFGAGEVREIERRLAWAAVVRERTIDAPAAQWRAAIESIGDSTECPAYGGLRLRPQLGLVPLRRDPASGLWEFLVAETGSAPAVDAASGRYVIGADTGLVLVLLPGGTFTMGAEPADAFDASPRARDHYTGISASERPQHTVALAPFFLSKYEVTQAQWQAITGVNPSQGCAGRVYRSPDGEEVQTISPMHPVEGVNWSDCLAFTTRLDLALPTEAQWEYGARAGTTSLWWSGGELNALADAGNLRDQAAKRLKSAAEHAPWDDGFAVHAPVGSMAPNPFGLHDVIGNVQEWCLESMGAYDLPVEPGTGRRLVESPTDTHVARGGGWFSHVLDCRSASRRPDIATNRGDANGLRPARALRTRG